VVATGIDNLAAARETQPTDSLEELVVRLRNDNRRAVARIEGDAPPPQSRSPLSRTAGHHSQIRPAWPAADDVRPAAPRDLDASGRSSAGNYIEDKILEIPAFLARKAN
jgi:hypothetical protein